METDRSHMGPYSEPMEVDEPELCDIFTNFFSQDVKKAASLM